jgi:hypothetical protein
LIEHGGVEVGGTGDEDSGCEDGGERSTEWSCGHGQTPTRCGSPDLRRMQT